MKTLILADGSTLDVESVTLEPHFSIQAADRAAFLNVWDRLSESNLQHVQIYQDEQKVAAFTDCELVGTQTVNNYDGSMIAHFYLAGVPMPSTDPAYEEAFRIMTGEVQA